MKKNLECKVIVKNGVRYYVEVSSNTCVDIICDDENAEEVCFDEGFDKVEIKLKSAGQLDNIKRIYIGESIKSMQLSGILKKKEQSCVLRHLPAVLQKE